MRNNDICLEMDIVQQTGSAEGKTGCRSGQKLHHLFPPGLVLGDALTAKPRERRLRLRNWLLLLTFGATLLTVALPTHATFPGSNGRIAFASERDGDFEIYTTNPDGTGVAQLTSNAAIDDRFPAWSPDGTRLAFASNLDGDYEIFVMCADGTGQTQLTFNTNSAYGPTWSPDGTKIAFTSDQDGDYEIFVINADGNGQTQITFNTIDDFAPAWSPDGARIAFVQGTAITGSSLEIWVMNTDGTGQTPLTSNGIQDTVPRWAPDGSKILFRRDLGFGSGWAELFTMNPNGTGQTDITNTATTYEGEGVYSPDGTEIAFNSNAEDPSFDIYVGGTRITNSPGQDSDIDWQAIPTMVPIEVSPPGASVPFTVSKAAPGQLDMAWEAACAPTYRIVSGSLSSLQSSGVTSANASPMVCGIVGTSTSQPMPLDSVFLLVAGDSGAGTGPMGNASSGTPRAAGLSCP